MTSESEGGIEEQRTRLCKPFVQILCFFCIFLFSKLLLSSSRKQRVTEKIEKNGLLAGASLNVHAVKPMAAFNCR